MKGHRSLECYRHRPGDESHATKVNMGAQVIMTKTPDQLTAMFKWTVLTAVFIIALVSATFLLLELDSVTARLTQRSGGNATAKAPPRTPAAHRCALEPPTTVNVTDQDLCSPGSDDPSGSAAMSNALMALNMSAGDVHYVFANDAHVPRLSACSLESATRAVGNGSRVNVFVVHGIHFERCPHEEHPVSLIKTLLDLVDIYGDDRLKVRHVSLEECLECSPFQGVDLSARPLLARFAVQLVLLWQFGGTVLDAGVVAFRGELYRANASADGERGRPVEYGDRAVISSPVACHAFIFDTMVSARNLMMVPRNESSFDRETGWEVVRRTVERAGRKEARPVAEGIVCHDGSGVLDDNCYYLDANASNVNSDHVHRVCPVIFGEQSSSIPRDPDVSPP